MLSSLLFTEWSSFLANVKELAKKWRCQGKWLHTIICGAGQGYCSSCLQLAKVMGVSITEKCPQSVPFSGSSFCWCRAPSAEGLLLYRIWMAYDMNGIWMNHVGGREGGAQALGLSWPLGCRHHSPAPRLGGGPQVWVEEVGSGRSAHSMVSGFLQVPLKMAYAGCRRTVLGPPQVQAVHATRLHHLQEPLAP